MRAQAAASPDNIDLLTLWGALRRAIPRLLLAGAVMGGATYASLSLVTPKYTSEAQLSVVAKGVANPFGDPSKDSQPADTTAVRMDKEAVNTHVRALSSTDLALKIVAELGLARMKEFNSALGPQDLPSKVLRMAGIGGPRPGETEEDRVLNAFFKQLEVYSPKESRFIGVRFSAAKPELAADVANRLAEAYRTKLAGQVNDDYDRVRADLEPKIKLLTDDLSSAETEVEILRGKVGNLRIGSDAQGQATGIRERELADVNADLSRVKAQRSEAEARARSAREMMKAGSAEALPDVQKSPLIQNLVQQRVRLERQVSELSASLLPGHPRMQQLNADLTGLKRQLTAEVGKVVESLEKEAKVATLREEGLQQRLDSLKSQIITVSTSADEAKLRQAEANVRSKKSELERLQAQFEAARARHGSAAVPVEVQIIQPARANSVPTFPKKAPYAGLIAAATMLFGMAWVVSKSMFVGARSGGAAAQPVALHPRAEPAPPVFERQPLQPSPQPIAVSASARAPAPNPPRQEPIAIHDPALGGAFDEQSVPQFSTTADLARHIAPKGNGNGGYRTMIAGERNQVAIVEEAVDLVKAIAASGKHTILIDWAAGGEGVAAALGTETRPGLADLLAGSATFEDVVRRLPGSSAHLIVAGTPSAGLALDPDQANLILDALDEAYDHVVICGRYEDARQLFEAIEGRIDTGVIVADPRAADTALKDPPGSFLGYEVAEIEIVRLGVPPAPVNVAMQRLKRVTAARGGAEQHPH